MPFEKRFWFYRDVVMGFSPAEIVGTVLLIVAVVHGTLALLN